MNHRKIDFELFNHGNKMKSIWIFNHYASSPGQSSGTRHYDFALELIERDYQVTIFASSFSHRERRETKLELGQLWKTENINGVNFVWIKTFPYSRNDWRRLLSMITFSNRVKKTAKMLPRIDKSVVSPDIVIGSSVHLFAVSAASNVAKHYKARFFMEVRDIWPQTLVDLGEMSARHPLVLLMRRIEMRLYPEAEKIITTLPYSSRYFSELGISESRLLHLPQGRNFEGNSSSNPIAVKSAPFIVAYVGSFGRADHVNMLAKAAEFLDQEKIRLVFVGEGTEKADIRKYIRQKNLKNVELLEPIPKSDVAAFLSKADACMAYVEDLSVRKKYGMSLNKMIDYLAAEKPIIFAGDIPNDVVAQVECGISVKPGDPRLIAEAISQLSLLEQKQLQEMGRRGRSYVIENHSIPALVDRLETLWSDRQAPNISGTANETKKRNRNVYRPIKRGLDIVGAIFGLAITSPLLIATAILIRLSMGSPVFFRQLRPGLNGRPFAIYKFRTMSDIKDDSGQLLSDKKRLTPVGRFLRAASLDELPEFLNVLIGEMSFVGPRPLLVEYLERYSPEQARRHEVKPGITGWAQINGRNALSWTEKFELDVWYVDNYSFPVDLKILWLTLLGVLKREGISADQHATMPEFTGSEKSN